VGSALAVWHGLAHLSVNKKAQTIQKRKFFDDNCQESFLYSAFTLIKFTRNIYYIGAIQNFVLV
jgi:hypothetical protein